MAAFVPVLRRSFLPPNPCMVLLSPLSRFYTTFRLVFRSQSLSRCLIFFFFAYLVHRRLPLISTLNPDLLTPDDHLDLSDKPHFIFRFQNVPFVTSVFFDLTPKKGVKTAFPSKRAILFRKTLPGFSTTTHAAMPRHSRVAFACVLHPTTCPRPLGRGETCSVHQGSLGR